MPRSRTPRAKPPSARAALLAALLPALAACAAQTTTRTGFLAHNDAAPLAADPADADRLVARAAPERLAGYSGYLIDDIAFRPGPHAPGVADAEVLADLRAAYRDALDTAFARHFGRAAAPGPGVLRVRAAITGYERANVAANVVTSALLIVPVTAGGAASEAEVVDSVTGERLAALATHTNGTPLLGGPVGYFTRHGHARRALARQADELAALVSPPAAPQ